MIATNRGAGSRLAFAILAICVALCLCATPASAAMQDKKTCKALKLERAELLRSGIKDNMANGPYWALDNLESDQITRIRRYLGVDETIMFQCPGGRKPRLKSKRTTAGNKKKIIRKKRYKKKKKTTATFFNPYGSD